MNLEQAVKAFVNALNDIGFNTAPVISDPVDVAPAVVNYEPTGWSLEGRSSYGAPRSKRVDELKAELREKGYTEIANKIPTYHCIAFWLNEPFPATIHLNQNKVKFALSNFGVFAPILTDFEEQQLQDNIFQTLLFRVPFYLQNPGVDPPSQEYRGEKGKDGFVKVGYNNQPDFSPSLPPNYKNLVALDQIHIPGETHFQEFKRTHDKDWWSDYKIAPVPNTAREDHFVYTPWWEGKTDENVGRYWRNWAVSVGADISL